MKKLFVILMISFVSFFMVSCTENDKAKNWGGNATLNLPKNQKLINDLDDDLWYLTRSMRSFGVFQGTYTIVESKQ